MISFAHAGTRRRLRASAARRLAPALVMSLVVASCAGRAPRPTPTPTPPTPPRARPGYEARVDSLDAVDTTAVAGRRIVLDPGHGGYFKGSIGVNGLTEASVNLDVALRLRDLLVTRGARVLLTRETDRDFLTPSDSALRADLTERMRIANAFQPDLFVSVHHNADAGGAHDRNEIQTYYKLGDEGPSLDAAVSLHRYLKRNLGIERHRILPGNYFVLRNSVAPAVLTEASYLTNPDVEARLGQPDKRQLEAEALFLGMAHYFARRPPVVVSLVASPSPDTLGRPPIAWYGPALEARVRGAFDQAELTLDGDPVPVIREGDRLRYVPDLPLAQGAHRAGVRVALTGHGAAEEKTVSFTVRRTPRRIWADARPETLSAAGGTVAVRARIVDVYGLPVLDSLRVRMRVAQRGAPRDTVLIARGGVAWGYIRVGAAPRPATRLASQRAGARGGRGTGPAGRSSSGGTSATGASGVTVTLAAANPGAAPRLQAATRFIPVVRRAPVATAFLIAAPGDSAVPGPPAAGAWVTPDGFAVFALDSTGRAWVPVLPGWRPLALPDSAPPPAVPARWAAWLGGALHGRRIVLDPDGGGADTAGMGPSGTRAAIYNMDVARALESYLVAAGAQVRLTRTGDYDASDLERVRISESFGADRYLRIGHRPQPPRIGFYFSSPGGKRWAQHTAAELARLGLRSPRVVEDAQYPLQQTSSPALFVSVARLDDPQDEERMYAPGALRAEAYALFLGLAREWAPEASWPVDSLEVRDDQGRPVQGAAVILGGAMTLETDASGKARFARTEPGPLEAFIQHERVRSRVVLLDSSRGVILTGPRGL